MRESRKTQIIIVAANQYSRDEAIRCFYNVRHFKRSSEMQKIIKIVTTALYRLFLMDNYIISS
jgi:hypothetical protein